MPRATVIDFASLRDFTIPFQRGQKLFYFRRGRKKKEKEKEKFAKNLRRDSREVYHSASSIKGESGGGWKGRVSCGYPDLPQRLRLTEGQASERCPQDGDRSNRERHRCNRRKQNNLIERHSHRLTIFSRFFDRENSPFTRFTVLIYRHLSLLFVLL